MQVYSKQSLRFAILLVLFFGLGLLGLAGAGTYLAAALTNPDQLSGFTKTLYQWGKDPDRELLYNMYVLSFLSSFLVGFFGFVIVLLNRLIPRLEKPTSNEERVY